MSEPSELDVLDPAATTVTYRGELLEIRPLTIGQLPKVVRLARPIIEQLFGAGDAEGDAAADDVAVLLEVIAEHGEKVIEVAAVVTGRPLAWLSGGDPAEAIELARAIYSVNRDFFDRRLAPQLAGLMPRFAGNGQTPSSS